MVIVKNEPIITPSKKDVSRYSLVKEVTFVSRLLPGGTLTVPAGYVTDGASIPWGFRGFVGQPFTPSYLVAAILHDFLYEYRFGKQKDADRLFLELLKKYKVNPIRRYIMWAALRMFGWIFWKTPNKKS